MTLVVQPHVVSHDHTRGLQVGSLVVVTENGAEPLQRYPMEFGILDGEEPPSGQEGERIGATPEPRTAPAADEGGPI